MSWILRQDNTLSRLILLYCAAKCISYDHSPIKRRVKFRNFGSLYLMKLGFLKFADVVYNSNKSLPCKFQEIKKKT